jgi:hypothetical protein
MGEQINAHRILVGAPERKKTPGIFRCEQEENSDLPFFVWRLQPNAGQGRLILEVFRPYTGTHHSR